MHASVTVVSKFILLIVLNCSYWTAYIAMRDKSSKKNVITGSWKKLNLLKGAVKLLVRLIFARDDMLEVLSTRGLHPVVCLILFVGAR
jgi:hypothetical protein